MTEGVWDLGSVRRYVEEVGCRLREAWKSWKSDRKDMEVVIDFGRYPCIRRHLDKQYLSRNAMGSCCEDDLQLRSLQETFSNRDGADSANCFRCDSATESISLDNIFPIG